MQIETAGKTRTWGKDLRAVRASEASIPQLAIGAETPKPMKLRKDSVKIASGIEMVAVTIIGPMALGSRCCKRIFLFEAPMVLAARMNSCSLRLKIWPRTIRAMGSQ